MSNLRSDRRRLYLRAMIEGFATGIGSAAASVFVAAVVRISSIDAARQCLRQGQQAEVCLSSLHGSVAPLLPWALVPAFIAPIIETVIFYVVFKVLHTNGGSRLKWTLYILTMGLLGWLLHGASWESLNRLVMFAAFAVLYARWAKEGSLPAFGVTAWAHVVANTSLLIIFYLKS
jgi:hypothetical protein